MIGVIVVLSATGLCALGAVGLRATYMVCDSEFFQIEEIKITGASERLEARIRDVVHRFEEGGEGNLFLLNLKRARLRIESLARVRHTELRKRYPRTLEIDIDERRPLVAINTSSTDLYWIDEEGVVLARATAREVADSDGPVLTGLRAPRFAPGVRLDQPLLIETLRTIQFIRENEPDLNRKFAEWNLSAQNEVTGVLNQGVEVRFGARDPFRLLPALITVLKEKQDLDRYIYFDLRFVPQIVYREADRPGAGGSPHGA